MRTPENEGDRKASAAPHYLKRALEENQVDRNLLRLASGNGFRESTFRSNLSGSPLTADGIADMLLLGICVSEGSVVNAVEESMRETLNSWSSSRSLTYKEKQSLKQYDIRQQMSFVLTKMRRHERQAWWFLVAYVVLMIISSFSDTGFNFVLVFCVALLNRGLMLRQASITLAKMETIADLWLRQNQSSLAEFDAVNLPTVKNEALAAGR